MTLCALSRSGEGGDLLRRLRGGAVLCSSWLNCPHAARLAHVRSDVDRVSLGTAKSRLRTPMNVQRCGSVASALNVGSQRYCDGIESRSSFNPDGVKSQVLRRLWFSGWFHYTKHSKA